MGMVVHVKQSDDFWRSFHQRQSNSEKAGLTTASSD